MARYRAAGLVALLLSFTISSARAVDGLVINEFLASNNGTYVDEDGAASDWIELFNGGTNTADLTDLYLTDDATDLRKWRFPAVQLGVGQFLVVFASDKNRRVPGQPLHTNFKLGADGEYLALVDGDGLTVLHAYAPAYPEQISNISYGISTNESAELRYFSTPTPGVRNSGDYLGVVADTKFSADRGFYRAPFELVVSTATSGADIRYTLDGSTPSAVSGTLYTGPIAISKTTVVRAIGYKEGYRSTDVDTQTYIFLAQVRSQPANPAGFPTMWGGVYADYQMDPRVVNAPAYSNRVEGALLSLPTVSLATHKDNLFSSASGIYANPGGQGIWWERPVSVEWLEPDGSRDFQVNAGIRVFGGYFRDLGVTRKKSLRLLFKGAYGPSKLEEDFFPDQEDAESYDTIVLRAGANDGYNNFGGGAVQYTLDEFVRRTHLAMGRPAAHGSFLHLYVDGLYWGLYNAAERPDAGFAATYCGGNKEDWDTRSQDELTDGTWDTWNAMINQCRLVPDNNAEYQKLQGNHEDGTRNPALPVLLDVENYADYILVNFWAGNADWPGNNWRAGCDRTAAGTGFKFFCWDAELAMLSGWTGLYTDMTGANGGAAEAFGYLRQNAEFRLLFADQVQRHLFNGGALTPDALVARYSGLSSNVEEAIIAETARWGDQYGGYPYTLENWRAQRDNMLNNYLPQRSEVFLQQLRNSGLFPSVEAPLFSRQGGAVTNGFTLTMAAADSIYYTLDNTDPRERGTGAARGVPYTSPIAIGYSVVVKARARSADGTWSPLNEAVFVFPLAAPLRVTEVMYHARELTAAETNRGFTAGDFDYVELHNATGRKLGLAGMRFTRGIEFEFNRGRVLALESNEYVVVVKNLAAFTNRYAGRPGLRIAGAYSGSLDNGGEELALKDGLGEDLLRFTYDNSRGWPVAADGAGHALVPRVLEEQNTGVLDYGGNWRAGAYRDGSPGAADPVLPAGVVLNEMVAHTDYTNALDSNDGVELFNAGAGAVSLAGWYLSDSAEDLKKWAIPAARTIAAGGWAFFDERTGFHNPITTGFGLNKAGEQLYLSYLPGTSADRVADCIRFKAQENGRALGRYPDGGAWWYAMTRTTNAAAPANAAPAVEVVISELMYHPRATADDPEDNTNGEYVELRNATGGPVVFQWEGGPWRVNGEVEYTFPAGYSLAAGGYVLIVGFDPADAASRTRFLNAYGLTNGEVRLLGPYTGTLSNRGGRVALERPLLPDVAGEGVSWVIVDEAIYFDRFPWPVAADGTGQPLCRLRADRSGNDPANWAAGFWGSPGGATPLFRISVPEYGETVLRGSSVPVAAVADPGAVSGAISRVEFFVDGAPLGADAAAPYEAVLGPLTQERAYTLTATLFDAAGAHAARPVVVRVCTVNNAGGATDIGVTDARLNGGLSNGGSADARLYWGPSDGGTNPAAWTGALELGRQTQSFSGLAAGLLANGRYYYRAYAANAYGALWAPATTSFVTRPPDVWLAVEGSPFLESGGTATVRANLSRRSAADVTAGLAFGGTAASGADYLASATQITIPAGQVSATATLTGRDDTEVEVTESITVRIAWLTLGATGTPAQVTASLISDDPRIVNTAASNVTDSTALACGNLTHGDRSAVTVYWGTSDGGTNPAAWAFSTAVGSRSEGAFSAALGGLNANQTYYYRGYALNSGGSDWADSAQSFRTGPPRVSIDDTAVMEGNAGTVDAVFPVRLSARSALPVSVRFATANGSATAGADYLAGQGALEIAAGQLVGQIVVAVRGDAEDEWPSESFVVNLSSPTNCAIADAQATGLIRDDDVAVTLVSWRYKMKIAFPGYRRAETLREFPALVNFNTNLANFAYAQFRGAGQAVPWSSLRFANSNVTALLNYEVEQWNTNGLSSLWVQVPELTRTNAFIWAYWGNPSAAAEPAYTTNGATWSAGYKGVWHMAQLGARDSTARRHHGAARGSVSAVPGVVGWANEFDADVDYIAVPDSDDFTLSGDCTISAWIRADDIGNRDMGFVGTFNGSGFMFSLQNDEGNTLRYWSGDWRSSDSPVPHDRWRNVVYTRQGATARFYIDGVRVRERGDALAAGDGGELHLGAAGTAWSGNRFDGRVDEVRIAAESHSSNWVWACWLNQASNRTFSSHAPVEAGDAEAPALFNVFGATNVTDASACLTARLTSTGASQTAVWVYWGESDGGTEPGAWAHTNAFGPVTSRPYIDYTHRIEGLAPNSAYYYAYRASNSRGSAWASTRFYTVGRPRVENTGGATNVAIGSAALRGSLLNASPAQVTVFWGPRDGGTDRAAWAAHASVGPVAANAAFAAEAADLLYGVRYYYRCYATNRYGEDWSDAAMPFLSAVPDANRLSVRDGLVLWLDAEDVDGDGSTRTRPADGDSVAAWRDRSGLGHHADNLDGTPATYAAAGLNERPVLAFGGNSYLYTTYDFDPLERYTLFTLARYSGGDSERVISSRTHNWLFGYWGNGDERWYAEGWIYGAGDGNTDWHLHAGTMGSDPDPGASFWKDGRLLALDNRGSHDTVNNPGQLGLGGWQGAGSEASQCEIAEVLMYDRVLTSNELDRVGSYLAGKYELDTTYSGKAGGVGVGVTLEGATNITFSTALLAGTLAASGSVFDVRLHWGDENGGAGGPWDQALFIGSFTNVLSAHLARTVAGLAPETRYFFTFSASNAAGTVWAEPSGSFITPTDLGRWGMAAPVTFAGYGSGETLYDFPVLLALGTNIPGFAYSQFGAADGRDLRFTDLSGRMLAYEVQAWNPQGQSLVWVRVPVLEGTGAAAIRAYWGNPEAHASPAAAEGAVWGAPFRGVWHMEQTAAADATGRGHGGAPQGAVISAPGAIGLANEFDPGEYISVPRSSDFILNDDYTVSTWLNPHDGNDRGVMGSWHNGFILAVRGNSLRFHASQNGGGWDTPSGEMELNRWHYATVTRKGATASLYLDGALQLTFTGIAITGCDDDLEFGSGGWDWRGWFDGQVDEARIESVERSADWVRACYSNQVPGSTFAAFGAALPFHGIANRAVSSITSTSAVFNALLHTGATGYYVNVYWGPSDGSTNASGWAYSRRVGYFVDTGTTNLSFRASEGVSEFSPSYYTWRVTNATYSYWAQPSVGWGPERVWQGGSDGRWGTAGNWVGSNAPDVAAEGARFEGAGAGAVSLAGRSYTNATLTFTGGDYTLSDTNAAPGRLWAGALRHAGGANTIALGLSVTGATEVSGGTLNLDQVGSLSAGQFRLSGGTLVLRDVGISPAGTATWDFETGDLSGWNVVPYTGGGSGDAFLYGHQPQNNDVHLGNWGINTWGQENPNGNSDYYTGIIETDPFYISQAGTVSFQICSAPYAFTGDPDSPSPNMACVTLEREVAPGDWAMIFSATHGMSFDWESKSWDTTPYVGSTVRFRIYDTHTGGWGHTAVDNIVATGIQKVESRPFSLTAIPVNVVGAAAIQADCTTNTAPLGALTVANGATLTTASGSPIAFQSATLAAGSTAAGFNIEVDTCLTRAAGLNGAGAPVTITKAGAGALLLNRAGSGLGNATFDIRAGALVGVHPEAFGGANLRLAGGDLMLSSPGGDVAYDTAIGVATNSTLVAGKAGGGVAGPLTASLNGGVNFAGPATLTLRATDNYTLWLKGEITGGGTLDLAAGSVIINDASFNAVSLNGGSLTVASNLTVNALVQNSGTFTMAGASKNLAVSGTLTLAGALNLSGGPVLALGGAAVTLNSGANLTYDRSLTAGSLTLNSGGALSLGTNALSVGTLNWRNGGALDASGPITVDTALYLWPQRTIPNRLLGAGDVFIGEPADTWGYVALTGTNAYTGKTQIRLGVLRADEGLGLPAASRLVFDGNHLEHPCLLEARGTFARNIGEGPGEVCWDANGWGGGWSARGGDLTVTLEEGAPLSWESADAGFNDRSCLQLGSQYADSIVELTNPIELNGTWRRIQIGNNPDLKTDGARLSGVISGSGNWNDPSLRFNESSGNNFANARIELTAANTYTQRTILDSVALDAVDGVGLPAASWLYFESNDGMWQEAVLLSRGTFARNIGSDQPGQVSWGGSGGFAARGGELTVTLDEGEALNWGDWWTGFNGQWLQLNSQYATRAVRITNPIDLGGGEYYLNVFDNADTDQDVAVLSGIVSGSNHGARFTKEGPGTLWLRGANTFQQYLGIDWGAVRLDSSANLPAATTVTFWNWQRGGDWPKTLESKGTLALDVGQWNDAGKVSWQWGDGGFSAYGGPLTVNLAGGATLLWDTWNKGFDSRALHLGSHSANDVVTVANALDTRGGWRAIYAWDNPHCPGDGAVVSNITSSSGANSGHLVVYGDGTLRLTGAVTEMNYLRVEDNATVLVNGTFSGNNFDSNNGQAGGSNRRSAGGAMPVVGGTGVITAGEVRLRGWSASSYTTLAPGDGVGRLTASLTGSFVLENPNVTYEWQLGAGAADTVAVTGNLWMGSGWRLKLKGAGGTPRPGEQYVLFTYSGTCTYAAPTLDLSEMPADWGAVGVQVVHDAAGKRVYLTGLYSALAVANDPAGDLTSTSATLRGFVSAQGDPLYVSVYWSTNDGGASAAAWLAGGRKAESGMAENVVAQSVTRAVTGLKTNQLWYYTFRATNAAGTIDLWAAPSASFRTLGPPAVAATGASGVGAGAATLGGRFLDHNRGEITLCWGTTDGGTLGAGGWQHSTNIGAQASQTFSGRVTGLLFPQGYVYRVRAQNAYGTGWSDPVLSFQRTDKPVGGVPVKDRLKLWLDASDRATLFQDSAATVPVTAGGQPVGCWKDKSGSGNHATQVDGTSRRPTYAPSGFGRNPALYFDGSDDDITSSFNANTATMSLFIVYRKVTDNGGLWGHDDGGWDRLQLFANNGYNFGAGGYSISVPGLDNANTNLYVALLAGGVANGSRIYVNGASKLTFTDNNSAGYSYTTFGNISRNNGWRGNVQIAEVVAYDTVLSAADHARVGGYLATKYGLATSYPLVGGGSAAIANAAASDVTARTGTLHGRLSCTGAVYDAWVYWGTSNGGTNRAAWNGGRALAGTVADATALLSYPIRPGPGTYWYTFLASNELDQMWAAPSTNFSTVAAPGLADADRDGLPDLWERQTFGGTNVTSGGAGQDWDGDGAPDAAEYTAGTVATNRESVFRVVVAISNGATVVSFEGLPAAGSGYEGYERRYDMEQTTNLVTGPWLPVPGCTNRLGAGLAVTHTNQAGRSGSYRARTWLR